MNARFFKSLLMASLACGSATAASESFKVMSFNILSDTLDDSFGDWNDPEHPRRQRVAAVLNEEDADLIGLQEVSVRGSQFPDLVKFLPEYNYVKGTSAFNNFANAIFYKRDRYQVQDSGSFALTSGAATNALWAQLYDSMVDQSFTILSLHLNPFDSGIRLTQTSEIQAVLPSIAGDLPVVIAGDFNFSFADSALDPVRDHFLEITGRSGTQNRLFADACMPLCGDTRTGGSRRIDYIIHSGEFEALDGKVVTTLVDFSPPSDHRPVTAELVFAPTVSRRWAMQSHAVVNLSSFNRKALWHSFYSPQLWVGTYDLARFRPLRGEGDAKLVMKFATPEQTASLPEVQSAMLRIFVADSLGDSPVSLSLLHSITDNDYQASTDDYDRPYEDTGMDLIVPVGAAGQYYNLDVTEFILANQLADSSNSVTAFRLEVLPGDGPSGGDEAAYLIDTQLRAPQLLINYVPEPSTVTLAVLALAGLCVCGWRGQLK